MAHEAPTTHVPPRLSSVARSAEGPEDGSEPLLAGRARGALGRRPGRMDRRLVHRDRQMTHPIDRDVADRTTQLRKLAAKADYSLTGIVCSDDPFPHHLDELCERLQKAGDAKAREREEM